MIVTLLAWVYFLCMFYIYGFSIVKLITCSKDDEATKEISPFLLVFIGLSVVAIISYYLSFFIPINASANAILLGGMIILLFFSFQEIHQKLKNYILVFKVDLPNILLILVAVMILLLVLIKTSTDVIHYDTGLYHSQSIQWYRRYAIVPGLGNIHFRLAYNSLIFPLFSLSDFSFITHHSLRPINGFIIANTFLLSLSSLKSLLLKKIELSNVFGFSILLFLINDNLFTSDISSLSSDLSGSIFILISVFLSLKYIESKIKDESKLYELLIILFSSIAVTVKLSNLPIFILTILIISRSLIRKQYSLLWRGTIIVTLIFLPYLIIAGPVVVSSTFLRRPWQILTNLNFTYLIILLIATACLYGIITYLYEEQFKVSYHDFSSSFQITEIIRLLKLGLLMIVLAYPSAILLDVNIIDGRASRVHFPAVIGSTLMMGSLCNLLFFITYSKQFLKPIIKVIISTYLAFLVAFSISVQQYYALSWQYQQNFWRDILTLSPDITGNTVILVQSPNIAWGKQINPFDWSVPSVLSSIYEFPKDWQFPPRAYILHSDPQNIEAWKGMIQSNDKMLISNKNHGVRYRYDWEPERLIQPQDVILLVEENKKLIRQPKLTLSDGRNIFFKKNDSRFTFPPFPKTSLFSRLIPSTTMTNDQKSSSAIYLEPQK